MNSQRNIRTKVFISYSHKDLEWLERLLVHLKPLERAYSIDVWSDQKIKPGYKWKTEIKSAIDTAKVIIFLVSAHFLASEFISTDEVPLLLQVAEQEGAFILPVILSPSIFQHTYLSTFQTVNDPSKPLIKMSRGEQEDVLVRLTENVETLLQLQRAVSEDASQYSDNTTSISSHVRLDQEIVQSSEAIARIEICHFDLLNVGKSQKTHGEILKRYHTVAKDAMKKFHGDIWLISPNCVISTFDEPDMAIFSCIELLNNLGTLNKGIFLRDGPFFVRIGIDLNFQTSIKEIPDIQRSKYSNKVLDHVEALQKMCPIGGIAISLDVYEHIEPYQKLFRPTPNAPFLVLQKRPLSPQEQELTFNFSEKQKNALPALCFLSWDRIRPDKNMTLKDVRNIVSDDLVVVLGDTSSESRGPLSSAATSDAVGLMEALSVLQHRDLRVSIDEWQDTADLVASRNVIILGSGATNMYALVLNDIFEPLHFIRAQGQALDRIVAGPKNQREFFGSHARPPIHSGIIILSKSVFNPEKTMIWMAGISGMGTQAVTTFFKDLLKGEVHINDHAIGCVIGPIVKAGLKVDIKEYYRNWRISAYEVLYQVDRDGNKL